MVCFLYRPLLTKPVVFVPSHCRIKIHLIQISFLGKLHVMLRWKPGNSLAAAAAAVVTLSPLSHISPRAGQPRGQGDGDPHSGAPAAREEQADAGAADETPGDVG